MLYVSVDKFHYFRFSGAGSGPVAFFFSSFLFFSFEAKEKHIWMIKPQLPITASAVSIFLFTCSHLL